MMTIVVSAFWRTLLFCAVLFGLVAPAVAWPQSWRSEDLKKHSLVGTIYDTRAKRIISVDEYRAALQTVPFVLLGEVHDNPDHHLLQAMAIRHLPKGHVTVVMEHLTTVQQSAVDKFLISYDKESDPVGAFFEAVEWQRSGWPDASIFRSLVDAMLARRVQIIAANIPRNRIGDVARRGLVAVDTKRQQTFFLDQPLGAPLNDDLLKELEASHCGLMPKAAFTNMAVAQRLRDAQLANKMVEALANNRGTSALVAGNGHVRLDRGVPWYLRRMAAGKRFISVGHIEVRGTSQAIADYLTEPAQYSFIVFTPRKRRDDPCEAMRARFGKVAK